MLLLNLLCFCSPAPQQRQVHLKHCCDALSTRADPLLCIVQCCSHYCATAVLLQEQQQQRKYPPIPHPPRLSHFLNCVRDFRHCLDDRVCRRTAAAAPPPHSRARLLPAVRRSPSDKLRAPASIRSRTSGSQPDPAAVAKNSLHNPFPGPNRGRPCVLTKAPACNRVDAT